MNSNFAVRVLPFLPELKGMEEYEEKGAIQSIRQLQLRGFRLNKITFIAISLFELYLKWQENRGTCTFPSSPYLCALYLQ